MTDFTKKLIDVALAEVGVREVPENSNRGPRVDQYLQSVRLNPTDGSYPWCAAFVYWCYDKADSELGALNQLLPPRTAGVLDHWNKSTGIKIEPRIAKKWSQVVEPGQVFCLDFGHGLGHMGLVIQVKPIYDSGNVTYWCDTVEGNTNEDGSRNGIGVFKRRRKISDINKGFISYE